MTKPRPKPKPHPGSKPLRLAFRDFIKAAVTGAIATVAGLATLITGDNTGTVMSHDGKFAAAVGVVMASIHLIGLCIKDNSKKT